MADEKRNCGNCFFWTPYRNPETGRAKSSEAGNCNYPVQWPTLPASFNAGIRLQQAMHSFPRKFPVWASRGEDCECWQP